VAVDTLLPKRCYSCWGIFGVSGGLCNVYREEVPFISTPQCQCCGRTFEFGPCFDAEEDMQCGAYIRITPIYDRARSYMVCVDACRSGVELLETTDFIAPVPFHWSRMWSRKFNQSAKLAQYLAQIA